MTKPLLCVIPYCGRKNYLRMLLATIKGADGVDDVRFLIYETRKRAVVPRELLTGLDAEVFQYDLGEGKVRVAHYYVWEHAFVNNYEYDHLLGFDCDAAVHPWAFTKVREMIKRFPDLGMGSLFNTECQDDIDFGDDRYFMQQGTGFLGVVVSRKVVAMMHGNPGPDSAYAKACNDAGLKIYCTRTSFVEHLGWEGTNAPNWKRGLPQTDRRKDGKPGFARARRFMSEVT